MSSEHISSLWSSVESQGANLSPGFTKKRKNAQKSSFLSLLQRTFDSKSNVCQVGTHPAAALKTALLYKAEMFKSHGNNFGFPRALIQQMIMLGDLFHTSASVCPISRLNHDISVDKLYALGWRTQNASHSAYFHSYISLCQKYESQYLKGNFKVFKPRAYLYIFTHIYTSND